MEITSCAKCETGPKNIEGHDQLFVHAFMGQNVMLKCRACGRLWTRKYGDNTQFEWSPGEAGQGALVPTAP
jgi:hypothetical protein